MIVLIGSKAMVCRGVVDRTPRDTDLVGTYDEIMDFLKTEGSITDCYPIKDGNNYVIKLDEHMIEAEIAWEGSLAADLMTLVANDPGTERVGHLWIPSINVLYLLKMSHRYLKNSPHFLKTMRDIQMMRKFGAVIQTEHNDFFKRREAAAYDYGHPKLNLGKKDFFSTDGVSYVYDHDTIHLAMAHLGKPAYKFYQPEQSEVNVSKAAFFAQPEQVRLYGVLEEAYVLALERSQIPHGARLTPRESFNLALQKVCTSITSGWFREYAWENYNKVQCLYSDNYVEQFWHSEKQGIVKRIPLSVAEQA